MPEAELRSRYGAVLLDNVSVVGHGRAAVVFVEMRESPVACAFDVSGHVLNVFTHAAFRGRGYASAAIKALQDTSARPGLSLECHSPLEGFYARLGFRRVEELFGVSSMRWTNPRWKSYPAAHAGSQVHRPVR